MVEERGAAAITLDEDKLSTTISFLSGGSDDGCESNENEALSNLEEEVF